MAEPPTPSPAASACVESRALRDGGTLAWRPLNRRDRVCIGCCLALVVGLTFTRLPPGICSADVGELQVAAPTLGITHAPGYPVFASIGYLATLLTPFEPAYAVTLLNYAAGLVLFVLAALLPMRLGVPTTVAVSISLCFLWPARTWVNILAPEVYAPTLALQATSTYLLLRYEALRRTRDLAAAALSFGVALVSRPPLGLTLPFVLIAWWRVRPRDAVRGASLLRSFALVIAFGLAPTIYSAAYLYVRDEPSTPFNYLHLKDTQCDVLPCASEGFAAKAERVFFHMSGCEFAYLVNHDWRHVWQKIRWFKSEYWPELPVLRVVVAAIVAGGGYLILRRSRSAFWPMLGMHITSVVYILAYKVYGQAADLFPMLWAAHVWFAVGISPLFTADSHFDPGAPDSKLARWAPTFSRFLQRSVPLVQRHGGTVTFGVAAALTIADAQHRAAPAEYYDARRFVREMDMETLPPNSIICVLWPETPVVYYVRHVLSNRTDILLLGADQEHWPRVLAQYPGRPVFCASAMNHIPGYTLERFRNMKQLIRIPSNIGASSRVPQAACPPVPTLAVELPVAPFDGRSRS